MNEFLTIGMLAGGGLLAYRFFQLNALAGNVSTRITGARVHQLSMSGLTIAVGIAVNNPTRNRITISKPVVVLTSKGKHIGESDASPKSYAIAAQQVSSIGEILIRIPLTGAMSLLGGIDLKGLFAAFKGQPLTAAAQAAITRIRVPVEAQITFYADSLLIKLPATKIL